MSNMDSILKHVSGIKVRGGNFENETSLGFFEKNKRICLRYEGDEGDVSPKKLLKRIGEVLRADNGWAERDAYIRDKKQKSRVNDTTYTQFIERTPQKDRDALLLEYAKKKDAYEIAKTLLKQEREGLQPSLILMKKLI